MKQERRKPTGERYKNMVEGYKSFDHEGKLSLANLFGVSLDTMKHWVSDGDTPPAIEYTTPRTEGYMGIAQPLTLNVSDEPVTVAIINDTHNPYQDVEAVALMEKVLEELQPEYLIYAGDVNDFYQLSKYDKTPARANSLQADINVSKEMFARHNSILPKTKKIMLEGTHEDRLRRYLWTQSPALASLEGLALKELFELDKFGISLVPFEQGLLINGVFLVLHGELISSDSSATAKANYRKHGGCGMTGHTHRGGSFYKRDRFGVYGWYENFCLCRLDPDWCKNPDWQQGFSLAHFIGKHFWIEQLPIINKTLMYGGKLYRT